MSEVADTSSGQTDLSTAANGLAVSNLSSTAYQNDREIKNLFEDVSLNQQKSFGLENSSELNSMKSHNSNSSTPFGTPYNGSSENLSEDTKSIDEETQASGKILMDLKTIEHKFSQKLAMLEDENSQLVQQITLLKDKIKCQEEQFGKTIEDIKLNFNSRLEKCIRDRDIARKDLESMVVKYAKSEKEVISVKKGKDDAEKKLRDLTKDKESLQSRVKALSCDKASLAKSFDSKVAEFFILVRENEKLKEEIKDKDAKWKSSQQALKSESEQLHFLKLKLEETEIELRNLKKSSEEISDNLDLEKDDSGGDSEELKAYDVKIEKKNLKEKLSSLEAENNILTSKIQILERERLDHEEVVSKLKDSLNKLNSEFLESSIRLRDMGELELALKKEKELVQSTKNEVARLSDLNAELTAEMESCRHKEGELLEFTERLTAKSVFLQSEHNALEEKCCMLQDEVSKLQKKCEELEKERTDLQNKITKDKIDHEKEVTLMARKIAEKTDNLNKYKTKKEELENEIKVMKKRHLNSVRELNKELVSMKKHMELCEFNKIDKSSLNNCETASNCSQSSSSSPNASTFSASAPCNVLNGQLEDQTASNGASDFDSIPNVDKQMLINKIFKLQKAIAKKQEKVDFLEEHNHQLLQEMKKKTKLIQHYILREEAGALTTNRMDENKKQLAGHKTVMSSLYKSVPSDSGITLNLSLEINRRLQAVLEDTILKNITLKENLDTLGEEIAKLIQQKDDRRLNSEKSTSSILSS